jgi:hypothetical protein
MKKTFLLFFICLSAHTLKAQNCNPDMNITEPGYYPESLPPGTAGESYNEIIQLHIPADTAINFMGTDVTAIIDSIIITSVQGLPEGLSYACNKSSCSLPGGETSCASVYGTIAADAGGIYPFVIPVRIYTRINGSFPFQQNDTIFRLGMEVNNVMSIKNSAGGKEVLAVYPNPASETVNIAFTQSASSLEISIRDIHGKAVSIPLEKELNILKLDTRTLSPGIYYGTAGNGRHTYHFRFIRK